MVTDLSIAKKPRPGLLGWLWRWGRWIALTLVVCTVGLWVKLLIEQTEGEKDLAAAVAETDAADPGWRYEEIEAKLPAIPDEENSATVIRKVTAAWGQEPLRGQEGRRAPNRRLGDEQLAALREQLKGKDEAVRLAVSLKGYPRGRATFELTDDVLGTLVPHVQPVRQVAEVLALDNERLLHEGRGADTPDRVVAALCASASLRDDAFIVSSLVRMATRRVAVGMTERALGMGALSDADCRRLSNALSSEARDDLLLAALRGERAANHRLFENLESGKVTLPHLFHKALQAGEPDLTERFGLWMHFYRLPADHAFALRRYNELCDLARLPPHRQQQAWAEFGAGIRTTRDDPKLGRRRLLSHMLLPGLNKVGEASLRDRATVTCAVVALAVERYRLLIRRWPASLNDLCPKFLPEPPLDPYTGKPLLLARRDDGGVVVYSVGENGTDDGGAVEAPRPGGKSDDVGLRLYPPEERGLPGEAAEMKEKAAGD